MSDDARLLAAAFRAVARQLPALRTLHRALVDAEGRLEGTLSAVEAKLAFGEDRLHEAIGASASPQIQHALVALRAAHGETLQMSSTAAGCATTQEAVKVLDSVLTLLEGQDLAPAMRLCEAAAAPSEPAAVGTISLNCTGLSVGETQALYTGLMLGLQIAAGDASPTVALPPELSARELERAIERHREAQMLAHVRALNS
jgi:hypothetical protein